MTLVWLATSFGYYLILTLVNTFDDVYEVAITNNVSEILAYFLSGLFYERIGVKLSLIVSFVISALGGGLLLVWGLGHEESTWFFVFFLLAKFGVTCTFNINYSANSYFFPTLFAATAFGFCNFLARLFSALSFIVSGLDEPIPMYIFTGLCIGAGFAALFLRTEKQEKQK